jgi:putative redox protein
MSTTRLVWHEKFRFTGFDSRGHEVPIDAHAEGTAGKPSDLLPLSLAACIAYDIVSILYKQRQDLRGLEATIESAQDEDPPWTFRSIAVHFVARGDVNPLKAEKAMKLAEEKYCSISATLRASVELTYDIQVLPE